MSNALINASSRAAANPIDDPFSTQGSEGSSGGTTFAKFTGATGQFTAGKDDDELEHGTRFAADMFNAEWVWSFWWDGEVMEQFSDMLRESPTSYDDPPMELPEDPEGKIDMSIEEIYQQAKDDPDFRDGWGVQASFNMRPIDGTPEEITLKLNQGVAMNAFHALRKSFGRQYKIKQGLIPIIELGSNKFQIKGTKIKRHAPTLKIVDWMSEEDLQATQGEDPSDYEDSAPAAKPAKEAEAPAETPSDNAEAPAENDAPAPARRGRRGARGANLG